ncbi:DinB family protein [Rhodococcus sp. 06-156-3C]|uniref:mycothiol transferase n=1 Tax=Nocardiaceae TaxID=85025 RepID=UPI000522F0DF|nr:MULTISPECIES: DUF664 domain-containing protein [Rhodococcus]OZD12563.1 DinB family protein [Rhodococcus sp. 06-156-4a]OZD18028.1 DinB family protein [Rhodococcus sp. 06-156-3C]OZD20412.1 DinB family protein [Rhodococcus sp. 06-156-4C]OZD29256.1 DinB family protein [Rhodococcus sp. 06-156-3]OZD30528.1 DinB family protein [Rhodococcus sp. 06-156-3b]
MTPRASRHHNDAPPPRTGSSEFDTLTGFLGYLRTCVVTKISGIDDERARLSPVHSGTNALGLVWHLAHVERFTFLGEPVADWAATFHVPATTSLHDVVTGYQNAVERADHVIASLTDPSSSAPPRDGHKSAASLRWTLTHMIEETARHAGHLDILCESIDRRTGR